MDLVKYAYETLSPLPYPVTHLTRPKILPGLSYHFFNRRPSLRGDGVPIREEISVQVDIWTRDGADYGICKEVKKSMRAAGFMRVGEDEDFERDTGLYHKIIVFYYEFEAEV